MDYLADAYNFFNVSFRIFWHLSILLCFQLLLLIIINENELLFIPFTRWRYASILKYWLNPIFQYFSVLLITAFLHYIEYHTGVVVRIPAYCILVVTSRLFVYIMYSSADIRSYLFILHMSSHHNK